MSQSTENSFPLSVWREKEPIVVFMNVLAGAIARNLTWFMHTDVFKQCSCTICPAFVLQAATRTLHLLQVAKVGGHLVS